ncbi:MAG: chitobiase/beta-hexosaminidase C-terminal domain-containing protein [Clostridiales bacterium]|nr:chitobiase/beta-hexosaminidase C-terminal domain-containing protein [Clostridiales bacterium]
MNRYVFIIALLTAMALLLAACGGSAPGSSSEVAQSGSEGVSAVQSITVSGDGIDGEVAFTLAELSAMPGAAYEHVYSTINNWPVAKFYAARGIRVSAVLSAAGVLDTAESVTFRSRDSYEVTLTRKQLIADAQYYFPGAAEGSGDGAEPVEPILAYEFKEGSSDMAKALPEEFCLIIGQRNHTEHTNPAFVENVGEIIISAKPPGKWQQAGIFPASGRIPAGESIKLQHPDLGLVKMYYTLDGTEPTELSAMYNPSTYQPELNKPIVFSESAVLKVLVAGFGREDSDVAVFEIEVQ